MKKSYHYRFIVFLTFLLAFISCKKELPKEVEITASNSNLSVAEAKKTL